MAKQESDHISDRHTQTDKNTKSLPRGPLLVVNRCVGIREHIGGGSTIIRLTMKTFVIAGNGVHAHACE